MINDMYNLYRVLVKQSGKANFQGTGQTEDGDITIEGNVINQMFYSEENAIKLQNELDIAGFKTKLVKG